MLAKILKDQLINVWCALLGTLALMGIHEELEKPKIHAARLVTRNYTFEEGSTSMVGILGQLKWASLKKRKKVNRLSLL